MARCRRAGVRPTVHAVGVAGGTAEFVGYRLGPFLVNPNIAVPEFGHDSNVFNEQTAPKEDYVVKFTPVIKIPLKLHCTAVRLVRTA